MGKSRADGIAEYKACEVCTRVCQTTHSKGLPHSVPRFHKAVADYSTPSSRNCYLQVPAGYMREHICKGARHGFVLEGVTGAEWEVSFNSIGLSGGWKSFATDYRLEKGDQVILGLVAPNRFYVNVFDKFGLEKVSSREPPSRKGACPFLSSTSEGFHTPLQVEHEKRCRDEKANGFPSTTTSPPRNMLPLSSNGVCADTIPDSPHVGALSLNRALELDPTRALIEKLLIREPLDGDVPELSEMSDSMSESEDLVQVLLAKAVLAKMRRKKLKKRSIEATKSGGTEVATPLMNENKAVSGTRKRLASLGADDAIDNLRDDDTGARGGAELEDAMHEEPRAVANGSETEPQHGIPAQDVPQLVHRETEAMAIHGEGSVSKELSHEPRPVFLAALVKEEPDLGNALGPYNETCAKCGLATGSDQTCTPARNLPCGIPESGTPSPDRECTRATEVQRQEAANGSENLETRTPKGNGRVTEDQKQKALEAATTFSANTKNPSAVVVMRISFVEKTCACFVSVKCAEMLPRAPAEITLVDSDGHLRKANWRPERRYMLGVGWKDFVDSKNLQVNDVCVMEVIEKSPERCKVLIHIFHAHEMDTSKENKRGNEVEQKTERSPVPSAPPSVAEVSLGARTRHQEKRSQEAIQSHGLLPSKVRKKKKKLLALSEPEVQLTTPSSPEPQPRSKQERPYSTDPSREERKERKLSKRERKKIRMPATLRAPRGDIGHQPRKRYSVSKLVDRRKSLQGMVFLVELKETVIRHKRMKTKQDEKGRWWVPHSHFTSDFSSCFVD